MKMFLATCCALLLPVSNAFAVEHAALPAGKPAGLHQAQLEDGNGMFLVAGAALVGITVALATASGSAPAPGVTPPNTSSTSTTGTSP
ncbi:MAG TPA: hypothetical protein VFI23_16340 [Rhizomicrobium sp.]|nr:hypothetical protein [Rhizomicrobium sp.]